MFRTSPRGLSRDLPAAVGLARAAIGIAHMIAPTRANELLAGPDASLATKYTTSGYAYRRIKHFSGYTVAF